MKKAFLTLLTFATTLPLLAGGLPVIDVANLLQTYLQVSLASNQVYQATLQVVRAGDPAAIVNIAGAALTLGQLNQPGVGLSLTDIQLQVTGQSGQSYNGNGLYQPVRPEVPLVGGQSMLRPTDAYRKHEALQQAVANYHAVVDDTKARRDALRDAQRQTTEQLKLATTDAETQKLKGILASQQSEMNNVAAERSEAATRVSIQHVANEADKARQQQAEDELRAASLQSALTDAVRFFKADSRPSLIPNPKTGF